MHPCHHQRTDSPPSASRLRRTEQRLQNRTTHHLAHDRSRKAARCTAPARRQGRVFPENLTTVRLYMFSVDIRLVAELPSLHIFNCQHTFAWKGVVNEVGFTTVYWLLGDRKRKTSAMNVNLDDDELCGIATA